MGDHPSGTVTVLRQFSRYVTIGVVTNGLLYGAYLLLTATGAAPEAAMTVTYLTGVALSFHLNRRWTFESGLPYLHTLIRFIALYASGYALNYVGLALLPDRLGLPHQLVQIAIMGGLVVYFFAMFRAWVFRSP
ncbi:MAG: GtrA family protein [Steroidobacteraceae bacterium]